MPCRPTPSISTPGSPDAVGHCADHDLRCDPVRLVVGRRARRTGRPSRTASSRKIDIGPGKVLSSGKPQGLASTRAMRQRPRRAEVANDYFDLNAVKVDERRRPADRRAQHVGGRTTSTGAAARSTGGSAARGRIHARRRASRSLGSTTRCGRPARPDPLFDNEAARPCVALARHLDPPRQAREDGHARRSIEPGRAARPARRATSQALDERRHVRRLGRAGRCPSSTRRSVLLFDASVRPGGTATAATASSGRASRTPEPRRRPRSTRRRHTVHAI